MGVKDLAGKQLLQWPDVFADVGNVNLFDGEPFIKEEYLCLEPTEHVSRLADERLKELRSDVCMKYSDGEGRLYLYIENQSDICNTMPIRDMGYQYAGYEKQVKRMVDDNRRANRFPETYARVLPNGQKLFPIITMILNYSKEEWKRPTSLLDIVHIPPKWKDKLLPLFESHPICIVNLAYQSEETVKKYCSDFRMIVEYLTHSARDVWECWQGETRVVRHPQELADMLYALSKDERYRIIQERIPKEKGDGMKMCELMDFVENRGIQRGINQGIRQVNQLVQKLIADGRYEELSRSAEDSQFQMELMKEYCIVSEE